MRRRQFPNPAGRPAPLGPATLLRHAAGLVAVLAAARCQAEPAARNADLERTEFECVIEARELVELSSGFSDGVVESVKVERGNVVKAGQPLVQLEASVERASVELARAQAAAVGELHFSEAESEYRKRAADRGEALFAEGISSVEAKDEAAFPLRFAEARVVQAQEAKKQAQLELQRAVEALARKTVRSPIDGIVVERMVSPGEWTGEVPLMRLAQIDPLNVEVIVPVSWYGSIREGMTGLVVPEQPVGGTHPAKVTIVDRVVDAASGTFGVRLELPNPKLELPAGLKCKVTFQAP